MLIQSPPIDACVMARDQPAMNSTTGSLASAPERRRWGVAGDWYRRYERPILGAFGLAVLLLLWEVGTGTGYLNRVIMSSPSGVTRTLLQQIERGELWPHLVASLTVFVLGFMCAAIVGIAVGFAAGWSSRAFYVLDPWITVLYSTPFVALIPLIIIIFGIGLWSKVFVVFLISLFPIIVNTLVGVQSTGRALLDVSRGFGASRTKQWTSVVIPGSTPFILTGLRLAGGHGMVGVVVAELIAGNEGIGFVLNLAGARLQSGTVMLLVLFLGLWGVTFAEVMRRIEARFEAWRP